LKRAIYTGRVRTAQAKRVEEIQAVADALILLVNIIMARNTMQMQAVLDRWAKRRQVIPAALTWKIARTGLQGLNLRGVFRFSLEHDANEILNRPGFRGGQLVKVKPGFRSFRRVADSSLPQPRPVEYIQSARAVGGG